MIAHSDAVNKGVIVVLVALISFPASHASGLENCTAPDALRYKYQQQIDDLKLQRNTEKQERIDNWVAEKEASKAFFEGVRERWRAYRAELVARIQELDVQTPQDQEAVEQLVSDIEDALSDRDAEYESVLEQYHNNITEQNDLADTLQIDVIETFQDTTLAAYEDAQASCEGGVNGTVIKETLRTDLAAANTVFVEDMRDTLDEIRVGFGNIAEERRLAMDGIKEQLFIDITTAQGTFQEYWGNRTNTTSLRGTMVLRPRGGQAQ